MMLSLFDADPAVARAKDVMCAACIGVGSSFITGETCRGCGGAGWLFLADHEPPCAACNDPRRASRPKPSALRGDS